MRAPAVLIVILAGCGRLAFDPVSSRVTDAPGVGDGGDAADAPAQLTLPPGAKIWLQMETDAATGIVDSAGGHAVACTGTCPARVAGIHGSGYQLASQALQITYAADLDASAGFTAALWVKADQIPSLQACVYSKPSNITQGWDMFVICVQSDGTTFIDGEDTTGASHSINGPAISLGTWHHLAFVWDGTIKRAYYDGGLLGMQTLAIGSSTDDPGLGTPDTVTLEVDDVVYYTRGLSQAEITMLATP